MNVRTERRTDRQTDRPHELHIYVGLAQARHNDSPLYTGRRYRLYKATPFNCWKLVLR